MDDGGAADGQRSAGLSDTPPSVWLLLAAVPAAWFVGWVLAIALWTPAYSAMADECGTVAPVIVALHPDAVDPDEGVDAGWCASQARNNVGLSLFLLVPAAAFGYLALRGASRADWSDAQLRGTLIVAALLVVAPIASTLFPQRMQDEGCRTRPQLLVALGIDDIGRPDIDARCQGVARSHLQALGLSLVLPGLALGATTMVARHHQRHRTGRVPAGPSPTHTREQS